MNQLERTLTSLEVAEMVGRQHSEVLKDIRRIERQLPEVEIHLGDYFIESVYRDSNNQQRPQFLLTKKGCELYGTRMTGEKGTQFAVQYIDRFNQMENHIKQNEIDTTQLSPQLQMMNQMFQAVANNELETKEAKELALQAASTANNISNIVSITNIDWRKKVDVVLKKIAQKWTGSEPYRSVRNYSYEKLEKRAGCNLNVRLNNRKERSAAKGMSKTYVSNINKLDVIAEEKRFVEIYIQVVKEMAIQFKVDIKNFEFEEEVI